MSNYIIVRAELEKRLALNRQKHSLPEGELKLLNNECRWLAGLLKSLPEPSLVDMAKQLRAVLDVSDSDECKEAWGIIFKNTKEQKQ